MQIKETGERKMFEILKLLLDNHSDEGMSIFFIRFLQSGVLQQWLIVSSWS
ncbi:hypothetical protein [Emticicia oligotrophica]|uniref:hypothetical protein n=1 Tax=Emticicia oligotrophica TaxID=312279 RepID=UPI00273A8FA6|nr:hypothetical protein [Emticicia oligotrophica]